MYFKRCVISQCIYPMYNRIFAKINKNATNLNYLSRHKAEFLIII